METEGKSQELTVRRWAVPFAGFLLTLMGGVSYAWGVFVLPLMDRFGWTKAEATLPFTLFMLIFAIAMVPAGRLQDKLGPRKISVIGAGLFLIGYGAAALIGLVPYLWWLLLSYGIVAGTACGLTYACVAPPARKWYPDKPGTAVSFAVMGFGLAAVVFAPLKVDVLIPHFDIEGTLLILAILVAVVCFCAALIINNPPEGWTPPKPAVGKGSKAREVREELLLSPSKAIRRPLFWILWLIFVWVIAGGLMCIGLIPPYGVKIGLTAAQAAVAMAIFAGFNGFGRPLAGMLADRFGVVSVMIATYIIQAATLLTFTAVATTLPTLYVAAALLGWGFAVTLGVFPTLTAICFGVTNLGMNYGMVFTAFGVGALAPAVGAWLYDITGSYVPAYIGSGVLATLGLLLCVALKVKYKLA